MLKIFSTIGRGFVFAALILGFSLSSADGAGAQEEEVIFNAEFRIDRWQVGGHDRYVSTRVYYGRQSFSYYGDFEYKGRTYTIKSFVLSRDKVTLTMSPSSFPVGEDRSKFTLHLGVAGKTLDKFNFSDASLSVSSSTNTNTWPGSYDTLRHGYQKTNGVIRITVDSLGDYVKFADSRPDPGLDSEGRPFSGRMEVLSDLNDDENTKVWRICNRGFGEKEAEVACRQLGLPSLGAKPLDLSTTDWLKLTKKGWAGWKEFFEVLAMVNTPVLLDNLECTGREARLIDCKHSGVGVSSSSVCPPQNTAAVNCALADDSDRTNETEQQCVCGKARNGICWTPQQCRIIYPEGGY